MPLAWILALFLAIPIVEIYVIIQVGQLIGAWPTVILLVVESLIGAWIIKHQGRRTWTALMDSIQMAVPPGRELADAALVLVGGTLLLTPGFVTDIVGFFCVLPFTRPLARRLLLVYAGRRFAHSMATNSSRSAYAPQQGDVHQIFRDNDPYH
jgi:UPF0716 protein FxsA